jgi:hypothetical protein
MFIFYLKKIKILEFIWEISRILFKVFFHLKCIKIYFFIFLNFIFNINISKKYKNIKKFNLKQNQFKIFFKKKPVQLGHQTCP